MIISLLWALNRSPFVYLYCKHVYMVGETSTPPYPPKYLGSVLIDVLIKESQAGWRKKSRAKHADFSQEGRSS